MIGSTPGLASGASGEEPACLQDILETWALSLGWGGPLERGMPTHSIILAWRIPMDGGAWQATVHGVTK